MKLCSRHVLPMLLALTASHASAAAMGSMTSSLGLFAALVALLALKGWPQLVSGDLVSSTAALVLLLAGAALFWRHRSRVTSATLPRCAIELPAGFDRDGLLAVARKHFVELQAAWDDGDIGTLRALTMPDLLEDLCCQLPERGQGPNRTDVLTLHAELLGFEQWGPTALLSVEFSGMIRESSHEGAVPFRELWMLAQSNDAEPRWRLARQTALL